jgi:uncharacterized membrane protein SpoIIM required for sporulation
MNLERFLAERAQSWSNLAELIRRARGRPERLGPQGVRQLGTLYRSAAADLALARRKWPSDPSVAGLENLVGRARPLVYQSERRHLTVGRFFGRVYWQRVRERPVPLLVAVTLLLGTMVVTASWAAQNPAAAGGLVPGGAEWLTEPRPERYLRHQLDEQAAFSTLLFTHNIQVTFTAFAGGALFTLGTALLLVFNGLIFGATGGLALAAGNARPLIDYTFAHGVLELSCVVVASAAGLRLGWAIVDPGHRRRRDAFAEEGRGAVEIILGTAPWLVVAGITEAFIRPAGLGTVLVVVIGLTLGALFWGLVWKLGGPRPDNTRAGPAGHGGYKRALALARR